MLALRGHSLGLEIHVLSASSDDPAAQVVRHHHKGDVGSETDLRKFLSSVDVATFESEFLDSELLSQISAYTKVPIFPEPGLMGLIQDRLNQKELLLLNKLPTAQFSLINSVEDAEVALKVFKGKYVLKQRRFGYDGYGTFIIDGKKALKAVADKIAKDQNGFIAEEFIPFKRELALMAARNRSGEITLLPLVETHQENSRCLWVKGPLKHPALGKLNKGLKQFLKNMNYVGVMGVELFETRKGLLINELAPRVHNSGHYSLDALEEDQFTLHLKAILGLDASNVKPLSRGFAMLNLLGAHSKTPSWQIPEDLHFHWYGKSENRPGRKMGHLTALGSSADAALKKLLSARKNFDV